jgi:hypothetical protein
MIIESIKAPNDAKPLLYADIQKGMKVIDNEGDIGVITECEDAHNVIVEYENVKQ